MEKNEEESKRHLRDVAQQNAIKRAASIGERKLTPEQEQYKLELRIFAAEASGIGSNKSLDQVLREAEEKCIGNPPAPNLHGECPGEEVDVAVPACVKDAMREAVEAGRLPMETPFITWMEKKVAEFNLVDPDCIAASHSIFNTGKSWSFCPEIADICTGFIYYPPEK